MRITIGLELNKQKFDVTLKGLLHGYKPVKSDIKGAKQVPSITGQYNLIVVGASVDGTTAYVKNIIKGDCPDNVLCIGANYTFDSNHEVDLDGFIVYLPELLYVSDGAMSQILYSLEKMHKALSEESDVQTYYGPGTMAHIYHHRYLRWLANEASFHVFDYNSKPEGKLVVFDSKLFQEYDNLYIKESNGLHRVTFPALFPHIEAAGVLFDQDLMPYTDSNFAQILHRCKLVNPNLRRYVHRDIAIRQFEYNNWILDSNSPSFVSREFEDRGTDRETLTWVNPNEPSAQVADSCVGGGKSVKEKG